MAGEVSDYRAVPLCFDHHCGGGTPAQPGSYDGLSWGLWDRYLVDIEAEILALNMRYFFAATV